MGEYKIKGNSETRRKSTERKEKRGENKIRE